jgi:ABC-type cobalamin/Fe3+-siderophores transport system ATPase subunit
MSFEVRRFELTLPTNGGTSFGLIGASRSGKTTLMKYLYRTHFKKHITVMSTMNPHASIYEDLDSKVLVCQDYHPELLREMHELNSHTGNKYPFLFISDDFVNPKIKNDGEVTRALTIYRNAGVSSIWSFQGRTLMSAVGRNNLNYIAVLKQQTPKEWECVIKEFLSMWLPTGMNMREMVEFCRLATEDHQFFFIDQIEGCCYLTKLSREQAGI